MNSESKSDSPDSPDSPSQGSSDAYVDDKHSNLDAHQLAQQGQQGRTKRRTRRKRRKKTSPSSSPRFSPSPSDDEDTGATAAVAATDADPAILPNGISIADLVATNNPGAQHNATVPQVELLSLDARVSSLEKQLTEANAALNKSKAEEKKTKAALNNSKAALNKSKGEVKKAHEVSAGLREQNQGLQNSNDSLREEIEALQYDVAELRTANERQDKASEHTREIQAAAVKILKLMQYNSPVGGFEHHPDGSCKLSLEQWSVLFPMSHDDVKAVEAQLQRYCVENACTAGQDAEKYCLAQGYPHTSEFNNTQKTNFMLHVMGGWEAKLVNGTVGYEREQQALKHRKGIVAAANGSAEYTEEAYLKAAYAVFVHFFDLDCWTDLRSPDYEHLLDFDNCVILMWNSINPAFVWRPNQTDGNVCFFAADRGGPGLPTSDGNGMALGYAWYATCPGLCPIKSPMGYGLGDVLFPGRPCSIGNLTVMQIPLGDPKGVKIDRPSNDNSTYQGCISRDGLPHQVWAVINPSPGRPGHHVAYISQHGEMAYLVGAAKTLGDPLYRQHYFIAATGDRATNDMMRDVAVINGENEQWRG